MRKKFNELFRAHPSSGQGWVPLELQSQELLSSTTGPIPMEKLPCLLRFSIAIIYILYNSIIDTDL